MDRPGWLTALVMVVACSPGCSGPALDVPRRQGAEHRLELEPEADVSLVPATFRGRLTGAVTGEPWLFQDPISDYHDHAIRRGELSASLVERAVPLRYWREGSDLLFQPLIWLEPEGKYSVALIGEGRVAELTVAPDSQWPRAERFFPAAVANESVAIMCGAAFGELPESTMLEPGATPVRVTRGIFDVARDDCITLVAEQTPSEPALLPASLSGALLEPGLFRTASAAIVPEPACAQGVQVAGACLEVRDDRVLVTAAGRASLWMLDEPEQLQLSLAPFASALLTGLNAASSYQLTGHVLLSSGERVQLAHPFVTQPPRRHLVINEVLANAVGPEPASEWIELVNDGSQPASLSGVWLEDASGSVPLPAVELAPSEIALLVSTTFRASGLDVAPPPDVRLVELPSLGARGLTNSGEPLVLVGPEGVLSRFPALAAPHAGKSLARRTLASPDDGAAAFAEHGAPGASPGAANTFD